MGNIRRHVRYTPLGKGRTVTVVLGEDDRRDSEVLDESQFGIGVRLFDVTGLMVGCKVVVEGLNRKQNATLKRLVAAPGGGFLVGLEYDDRTTD